MARIAILKTFCCLLAVVTAQNLRGKDEADYVIVGAGTAGATLASKLARAGKSVILLEAGPDDDWKGKNLFGGDVDVFLGSVNFDQHTAPEISTWHWFEPYVDSRPADFTKQNKWGGWDDGFYAMQVFIGQAANSPKLPIPADWDRRMVSVASKIVGGCSAHNFFMWLEPSDQSLNKLGPGWEAKVLKAKYDEIAAKYIKTHKNPSVKGDMSQQTFKAFMKHGGCKMGAGTRRIADTKPKCGIAATDQSLDHNGRRISSGSAFLTKDVRSLPNFQLRVNSQAKRVLFEGTKAVGVEYFDATGAVRVVKAKKEIVLSAGVYVSPQLLMLSGVGPKKQLDNLKIPVVADSPSVGENYQDHPLWIMTFHVPVASGGSIKNQPEIILAWAASFRSSLVKDTDEADLVIVPSNAIYLGSGMMRFEIGITLYSKIENRGTVSLRSNSILDLPKIDYAVLKPKFDMDRAVEASDYVRDVVKKMGGSEIYPAQMIKNGRYADERDFLRKTASLVWHGVGTNSIGKVVDQELRVEGVSNLRVVDNSIVSHIPNSNTQTIAYMAGFHGADIILGEKWEWKVTYPSCTRGYWANGCGQPAMKQKGTAKCYRTTGEHTFEVDDKMCKDNKPAVTERTCPSTPLCARCKGCKRNGDCYKTCGGKAGKCSKCDSRDGRLGACCRRGATDNPIECNLAEFQFNTDKAHTCALLPKDAHTGYLLKDILSRLGQLEKEVDDLQS